MDLRLFAAVIKRRKKLVGGGAVLVLLLAVLSYGTPTLAGGKPTIKPRGATQYDANAELLITQSNDPYGNTAPAVSGLGGYFGSLSAVYAAIANGDLQRQASRAVHVTGTTQASEVVDPQTGEPEPLVTLTSTASSSAGASKLVAETITLLQQYVARQQLLAGVSTRERVVLEPLQQSAPVPAAGHKSTIALLIAVGGIAAVFALAFILENGNQRTAVELGRIAPADDRSGPVTRHRPLTDTPRALVSVDSADPSGTSAQRLRERLLRQ